MFEPPASETAANACVCRSVQFERQPKTHAAHRDTQEKRFCRELPAPAASASCKTPGSAGLQAPPDPGSEPLKCPVISAALAVTAPRLAGACCGLGAHHTHTTQAPADRIRREPLLRVGHSGVRPPGPGPGDQDRKCSFWAAVSHHGPLQTHVHTLLTPVPSRCMKTSLAHRLPLCPASASGAWSVDWGHSAQGKGTVLPSH